MPEDENEDQNTTTENGANEASKDKTGTVNPPALPYHDIEFEEFLDSLSAAAVPLWKPIAKTLGIHRNTITRWSKHPRAIEAKKKGLNVALEGMAVAGMSNYQMWEKYLHLLGLANNLDEVEEEDKDNDLVNSIKDLAEGMKLNAGQQPTTTEPDSSQTPD